MKKTLVTLTLAICGFINLQAIEGESTSQSGIYQEASQQQEQLAHCKKRRHRHVDSSSSRQSSTELASCCCGKRKKLKQRPKVLSSEETFAGCKRCKDKHNAIV